jgi:nicotinic acetylcholine receptor
VAKIKWWLRQAWKDSRLEWDSNDFTYDMGNGETGKVASIQRPGGAHGGVWIPDMVLWQSLFDGSQSTAANADMPTMLDITPDGKVFWSLPQVVNINMVPRMVLTNFPFDKQTLKFTFGPWTHSIATQNTTFPVNPVTNVEDGELFATLQGTDDEEAAEATTYKVDDPYIATEEWSYLDFTATRNEDKFPCCPDKFVTLVGEVDPPPRALEP